MPYINIILVIFSGFAAGFVTAAAFVAFIAMLGIFPKVAAKTKTAGECILYENCLMLGIFIATLLQFFAVFDSAGFYFWVTPPAWLGISLLCITGLFGGIYIGFLIGGLSEMLNVIPIYARKAHIKKWVFLVIYFFAFGKALFTLVQFFVLKM